MRKIGFRKVANSTNFSFHRRPENLQARFPVCDSKCFKLIESETDHVLYANEDNIEVTLALESFR